MERGNGKRLVSTKTIGNRCMDDCQIAPTVAVMILTFNFQFSNFHAPKARFHYTQGLDVIPFRFVV